MFESVLFPVTLRESRAQFLSAAVFLHRMGAREFFICHVLDTGFGKEAVMQKKAQAYRVLIEDNLQDATAHADVLTGHAGTEIITHAERMKATYIFIPAGRKRWLGKILVGSTAADVVRLTTLPVFVHKKKPVIHPDIQLVNQFGGGTEEDEYVGHIDNKRENAAKLFELAIAAIDFGATTERTTEIVSHVSLYCPSVLFFHVGKRSGDPYREAERKKAVKNKLTELKESFYSQCHTEIKDVIGLPSREIIRETKRSGADLVIMGKSNEKTPGEMLLGSTAERVLNNSETSLIVTP